MYIYKLLRTILFFCFLGTSWHANAVIINGATYLRYSGSGVTCPSGTKVYIYNGAKFCRFFRVNISWDTPTTRTDGSPLPLSELSKYELLWLGPRGIGTIEIPAGAQTTTTISLLTPGTYFFAIAAIDSAGARSRLSTAVKADVTE